MKDANINPRKIVNFRKFAKIYTCENIYIHSTWKLSEWIRSICLFEIYVRCYNLQRNLWIFLVEMPLVKECSDRKKGRTFFGRRNTVFLNITLVKFSISVNSMPCLP